MARYRRRRSRRRASRRKSRRAPRRYMARKSRRSRPSVNRHHFVRTAECVIYNDPATNVPCVSSDALMINTPAVLSGGSTPYGSSANYSTWVTFALDRTVGYNDFTSLYDQYKIKGVRVTFEYASNVGTSDFGAVPIPKIVAFRDFDDANLTTMMELNQREAITVRRRLSGPVSMVVKPRVRDYIQGTGGGSTSAGVYQRRWIDMDNTSVTHFGLKFALLDWPTYNGGGTDPATMARPILRIRTEYYLAMRNVR